jgi:hypothetical protein
MRKTTTFKRLSGWLLFLLCAWLLALPGHAQTYLISGGSVTTCAGTIYDSGGAAGNYANNENRTATLTPATAGSRIRLTFSVFNTENTYDFLRVYDGANASAPLIGAYTGTTSPGIITATNAAGQLTLVFTSDGSAVRAGFEAAISCFNPATPVPTITSFTPTSGPATTSVVITGTNFTGATSVLFNGTLSPTFNVNSATQITAIVPAGASTGPISVATPGGTAVSTGNFDTGINLMSNTPITTCSGTLYDSGGATGDYGNSESFTKTITPATAGAYVQLAFTATFALETCCDYLRIYDGANASAPLIGEYRATSPGTVTATNATGQLTLVFSSDGSVVGTGFEAAISCVTGVPTIASFTPTSGPVGTSVVITGSGFTGTTALSFNNVAAPGFVVNSSTQITATVPAGAATGRIRVTTPVATAVSATDFTVPAPAITSFTPTSGPVGTSVVITGSGFAGATAVSFNNVAAPGFVVNSATQITVSVPTGAGTGAIRVTTPAGTVVSGSNFTVPPPTITSFTPTSGPAGTSVVITGTNFTGTAAVLFNGATAPGFVVDSDTQITVSVPANASTGPISVTNSGVTVASTGIFSTGLYAMDNQAVTTCTGTFTDSGGPAASYGNNQDLTKTFSPGTAGSFLQFTFAAAFDLETCCDYLRIYDGANASAPLIGEYRATSPGTITATNATGQLTFVFHSDGSVTGTGWSAAIACVSTVPTITSFTPASGLPGTSVVIRGTNFTGATAVSFNNIAATGFVVDSANRITATVPTGATTGRIRVTTPVATATSATDFTVPAPTIASFTPANGPAGTSVVITGTGFTGATAVSFFGTPAPGFVVNSATQITVSVPANAYSGPLSVTTPAGNTAYLVGTAALTTCTGTLFDSGGPSANYANGENLTTTLSPATAGAQVRLVFAALATESCCDALRIYDGADASAPLIGTYGGTTSPGTVTATNAAGQLTLVFTSDGSVTGTGFQAAISCVAPPANLIVTNGQSTTASGSYNNITVQSGGTLTLTGATTAAGAVQVQSGGVLITNCQTLNGAGSFALQTGAELRICDPAGIATAGATGAIQVTGTRTYASDASYTYNGTVAQVTGAGLPATVRNLTVNNAAGLTLSQAVSLTEVARLQSGNLATGGFGFTLLSSATGTALVDNTGGTVTGTATMQRAITNAVSGPAYRHFSSPVQSTTLADLTTTGFAPTFNTAYNGSAAPSLVTPFPTVFGYDQARIASVTSTYSAFDKGWFSPAGSGDVMQPTRGYTVNAPATATPIDFVGTFNNAAQASGTLSRGTDAQAGWQLLGNPYPSPLDWNTVTAAQRPGMDAAMYVYQSTGQYAGTYRSFDNGIGASPLIVAGSGYFARVSAPGGSGSVNLTNANRVTTFDAQPAFGRGNDTRPQLHLTLTGTGSSDETFLYLQAGATAAIEPEFDATKLANPTGLDLASLSGTEALAINGLAPLTRTDVVVPLLVRAPQAGSFSFEVADLANFGATTVYLRDALTGTQQQLVAGTRYTFSLATATAGAGRFSVVFRPANVTATKVELDAASVSLYPNPAHGRFTVLLPPLAGQREVHATLFNALGQAVLSRTIGLTAAGATAEFNTQLLATGVYTLRLQAENQALTKRVVIK